MQISLVQTTVSVQDIYVNAGLLSVEYGGNINNSNAGTIFVGSGANFGVGDYALSIAVSKPIALANNATFSTTSGGANGNAVIAAAVGLTGNSFINPQSGSTLRLDGALTGTGGFTQNGAGTIDLTANSTYDGDTTVSAGRLLVNGSLGDTEVTVALGATLGGSGVIGTNSVLNTLTVNGTLAPGNSPGILTVNDNLGLNGALAIEVNDLVAGTGHDQVIVNGDVALGGLLTLAWNLTSGALPGTELILIDNDGSDVFTGSFSNAADLSIITDNLSGSWQVRYSGGSGNDLSIYAIPEPSTSLLTMAGVLGLTLRRRRSGV
jgi:autotransporter-associated beta strand protein